MHKQFARLFMSIAGVIALAIVVQFICITVSTRMMVYSWTEQVLDEFAMKIDASVEAFEHDPNNTFMEVMTGSSNERISGFILRSSNGQIVTFGHSGRGIPVPQLNYFTNNSYQYLESAHTTERKSGSIVLSINKPKYEVSITTIDPFSLYVKEIDIHETGEKGKIDVSYPNTLKRSDIAGTIVITVNGNVFGYLDVLVYSVDYYTPTRFILTEFYKMLLVTVPIALICSLALAIFVSRTTDTKVKGIVKGLDRLSKGDFDVKIPDSNIVEFDQIGNSISKLGNDLKRHSASRKEWIRNISHDLNTPVTSMNMLLEGAEDGLFPLSPDLISSLKKENDTLKSRIASVAYYSYLLSPDVQCAKVESSLFDLVDMVIKTNKVSASMRFDENLQIYADINLMTRAFSEILKNANEYGNGEIATFKAHQEGEFLTIEVKNRGSLPSPRPQFFEPWARGDASRTSGGSGLGLPIVYQTMVLHEGSVTIDEADGIVTVCLMLPMKKQ